MTKDVVSATEKLAAKVDGLIKDAPRSEDGTIEVRVTLMGDGMIHKGTKPGECFEDGDTLEVAPESARSLAIKGLVSIAKPKAKKAA